MAPGSASVPQAVLPLFRQKLESELYINDGFAQGNGLTLAYKFTQYTQGHQFQYWFNSEMGNGGSEAAIGVTATFTDASGRQIGAVTATNTIGVGPVGKSIGATTEDAALEIANYAKTNFK